MHSNVRLAPLASMRSFAPLLALALGACASSREAPPSGPVSAELSASAPTESVAGAGSSAPPGAGESSGNPEPAAAEPAAAPVPMGEPGPAPAAAPDCDARRARIDARIEDASRCSTDADCTTLMPGCPFGCFRPIHRATDTAAIEADIEAYRESCAACVYRCRALEHPPVCRDGRCITD